MGAHKVKDTMNYMPSVMEDLQISYFTLKLQAIYKIMQLYYKKYTT